ncbi:MAG: hypothetical protein JXR06_03045 [Candidatus Atelocyanobacterium thalassa]
MKISHIRKVKIITLSVIIAGVIIRYTTLDYFDFFQSTTTPIQKLFNQKLITTDTNDLTSQTVYLKGKVLDSVLFLNSGSYQLQDKTGTIWVLKTFNEMPKIGELVKIKGEIIYQPILIDDQDIGEFYIIELERLN